MADSSLASLLTLLTAIVVLATAVITAKKAKKVAAEVQKDVQQIVVNVDGRLSELLEMNQIFTTRINQLTASLQGSDTEVPDSPEVVRVVIADQPPQA